MSSQWSDKFFNHMYWDLFMKRTPKQIQSQVNLIKKLVTGHELENFLDVCCGVGDIAHQLEKDLKIDATGLEYSPDYVAQSYLKNIIQGDACQVQSIGQFSLVLNWYSSFAYFAPEKNKQLLKNCYDYCNDVFLLESYNPYAILSEFKKSFQYDKTYQGQHFVIDRKCNMNILERKLEQTWEFQGTHERFVHDTFSYLYFPDELVQLLTSIGFKKIQLYGVDSEIQIVPLELNTPRLIIKAVK